MGRLNLPEYWVQIAYLVTAVMFIIGLKRLSSPATARSGNQVAAVGMAIAVFATLFNQHVLDPWYILVGSLIGGGIGWYLARGVEMTAMPQMVALFNGMGGGAAAFTATAEFLENPFGFDPVFVVATILGVVIGSISLSGSVIALGKLQGFISSAPVTYKAQQVVNASLAGLLLLGALYLLFFDHHNGFVLAGMIVIALILGVAVVMPIGGADMPVVISLLNSFTGLAVAFGGFVLGNNLLIISGTLVGASGTLLTQLMSKAMNRSLTNVLFGAFGTGGSAEVAGTSGAAGRSVREVTADDAATLLAYANQVIIVPGYGMAVARAQNAVQDLAKTLEEKGVEVKYAIHPVAGRMPGHMNVLLAEADVPYTQLFEMDDINSEFSRTDVALVIGANDVVNPAARSDTQRRPGG
jgi:NAD(P) transhydrogenase subunit beta